MMRQGSGHMRPGRAGERAPDGADGSAGEFAEPASDTMNTGSARQPPGGADAENLPWLKHVILEHG
jgi:hypothetical protein